MLASHELYATDHKVKVLTDKEIEFIEFFLKSYTNAKQMPTQDLFELNFPEAKGQFSTVTEIDLDSFRVYMYNLINNRVNKKVSQSLLNVTSEIEADGLNDQVLEKIMDMHRVSNLGKVKEVATDIDFRQFYQNKLTKAVGLRFFIEDLDSKIGGLSEGTLTTIAGFTSHYKSTLAMNMAYKNVYFDGYNLAYISLETLKEEMYTNLLCRHSYDTKFSKYGFIAHDRIRKGELTPEEIDYLFDVVDADFRANARGKLIILDESDFISLSTMEFYNSLEILDDELTATGGLDGYILDYIQLLKFGDSVKGDDNRILNGYISFFRRITQSFRTGSKKKKLIGVILSQINRDSWGRAVKNGGRYDLRCLADANELERGSHRVITTYTSEVMKINKEAQVSILKNRMGMTMYEPSLIMADGEAYVFGDDAQETMGSPPSSISSSNNIGSIFNDSNSIDSLDSIFSI